MESEAHTTESVYDPRVRSAAGRGAIEGFVRKLARALTKSPDASRDATIRSALDEAIAERRAWPAADRAAVEGSLRVLSDLALQGWRLSVVKKGIRLLRPRALAPGPNVEKDRIRSQELMKRDEQLAGPAVRAFVKEMEQRRISPEGFASIFSLFRDGRDLAERLREARRSPPETLAAVIDPYLVFVGHGDRCPVTGLRLMDVWRYFRHTWANQYTSVPGRSMMFLVRDRAAPSHPVMGIGAISSPIVQIRERDVWIGWHPETFLEDVRARPTARVGTWLKRTVDGAIDELYIQDFLEESEDGRLLSLAQLRAPTQATIDRLREHGELRRERHRLHPDKAEHTHAAESNDADELTWADRARTNLFTSKRALALSQLLEARRVLGRFLGTRPTKTEVAALAADRDGRRVIQRVVRKAKADRVGIAMADISVCGAIPPYGDVLGGKLVAMLAASPEVVGAYRQRYKAAESEIASAMAGAPTRRPSDLVLFGTTSLYGRSSQYNRVRVPGERLGGAPGAQLRYIELGESESFGTSHYSAQTLRVLDDVIKNSGQGKRVNFIFGEGTSPKLRKVRDGLVELGFSEELLRHYRRRVVYGIPVVENLREYLLGMDARPRYLFKSTGESATAAVAAWWRERWLAKRIHSDAVLDRVAQHDLTWPIRHGARVKLPPEDTAQLDLFEDL